jgi:hypothetical protein
MVAMIAPKIAGIYFETQRNAKFHRIVTTLQLERVLRGESGGRGV